MAGTVTAASGFDLDYVWRGIAKGDTQGEHQASANGYYINAAQAGEAPGRWFGRGAEALGFHQGQEVEQEPYRQVYKQIDPRDGVSKLGRAPAAFKDYLVNLNQLKDAEPHATGERLAELERQAAQATRKSPAYTDVTASISKSISIFHASIRENERQARLAGDTAAAAYWHARDERFQEIVQDANRAGLEHLQQVAVTRVGSGAPRVDGQEPIRYEPVGMVVTSWLQGTSRDGDPQLHVHNQIARMGQTARDGKWRALDTMTVRAHLGAVRAIFTAHLDAALTREFGVEMVPREDGAGNEIKGISREQIEKYSSRTQQIKAETEKVREAWVRSHGREPTRRELLYIQQEATMTSRQGKEDGAIDWDAKLVEWEAKWDKLDGTSLAGVAPAVSDLRGPGGGAGTGEPDGPGPGGPAPTRDAQAHAMQLALARVQAAHSTWTRADLMREISDSLPPEARVMDPAAAVDLVHDMTDRAIAGEAEQVVCLDAPEWPPLPDYLRRDLDGRSVYTRPGTAKYATQVQLSREEQLIAAAGRENAPSLTAEQSAELLGADAVALEAAGRERAQEATAQLPSGVRMGQAAAINAALTSPRTVYPIVGAAGTGKTHTISQAARMWEAAGLGPVIGVAPSQAARNVLAEAAQIRAYNTAQFLGHHPEKGRGALGRVPIGENSLILVDEASMVSMEDLADIVSYAEAHHAKVVLAGDHGQLTAVESGGGMQLVTRQLEYAQLAEPVRFAAEWEGEASLRLRTGDAAVLTEYDQHGRIHGGDLDHVMDEARKAYLASYLQGRDVLLMAQNHETCRELSQRIRDDLQHLGVIGDGPSAALRDGARASVGDLIITRKNNHSLGIANGDTWRVEAVDGDDITMRRMIDADRATGERQFADETIVYRGGKDAADLAYAVDEHFSDRPADLAYSITGHSAQGRTVAEGLAVITGTETREWAYVAASRGVNANHFYVATEPARVADPAPGVRPAPELARHDRIQAERAGELREESGQRPAGGLAREPIGVLSDVLENEGAEMSALEVQRRNLANADHLAKLHAIWQGETSDAVTGRYERLLRDQLPDEWKNAQLSGHATWLWRTLRGAEAAGQDAAGVLARAIRSKPLTGSRDLAAVIDGRIREQTGSLVPQDPGSWVDRVPDIEDSGRREYVGQLAEAMDARTERLGEFTAKAGPVWATHALGEVPADPVARLDWEGRASKVAAYREMYGYADPGDPIGPEPVNSPEARAAWHAAFAALGPVDGINFAEAGDKRLLNLRATYEAETAWAPRYVGDELRLVRLGVGEMGRDAALAAAQAEAARGRGDQDGADLHDLHAESARANEAWFRGRETELAEAMEARAAWEQHTERTRHLAVAAHSEYMRRHPDAHLPPMRSAEPPQADENERAEILTPTTEHETPQWVAELAESTRSAMARIDEVRGLAVPNEDHEWEPVGEAWPDELRRERDAVLQPPKPEIKPAEPVAQMVAERAGGRTGEHEAGE
jgi:conjugative relaxase-like TrwC/TraI family protein